VRLTGARSYIPSAGPACDLDPSLERYNDHEATIFPLWENVADAGGSLWGVRLGRLAEQFVIEGEEPYNPAYTFYVSPRVLRAIVEGRAGWEEALLSHRITLRRNPDVFDPVREPAWTPELDIPVAKKRCRETLVTPAADLL
jgi:hypothetical protein